MTDGAEQPFTSRTYQPPPDDEMGGARWDDVPPPGGAKPQAEPLKITATPFVWRDPKTFPRRRWLYSHHLIRKFVSCTVSPGGLGKTSLVLVEAVAMASGRPLLGITSPEGPLTVWVINLEDPQEEIERRVTAILLHYKIDPEEIAGRLFLDSGRHLKVVVAEVTRNGTVIMRPVVDALTAEIRARKVDVTVIDPFVKAHRVPENDNGAVDVVCTVFADIADACDCAFDLIHHVRKLGGAEATVEDGRGASSILGAVRSARVLNGMTKDEAAKAGEGTNPREFFRVDNGKLNMAPPPSERSDWYRLLSVPLGNGDEPFGPNPLPFDNGDHVQCVVNWEKPDPMASVTASHLKQSQIVVAAGRYRENSQAKDWIGHAIARVMGLDMTNKAHKATVLESLRRWRANGMFVTVEGEDEKRMKRTYVEVGVWATD